MKTFASMTSSQAIVTGWIFAALVMYSVFHMICSIRQRLVNPIMLILEFNIALALLINYTIETECLVNGGCDVFAWFRVGIVIVLSTVWVVEMRSMRMMFDRFQDIMMQIHQN